MKTSAVIVLLAWFALSVCLLRAAPPADYASAKTNAEALYAEHSYAKAHEAYVEAAKLKLSAPETRWVDFRLADTLWRAESATRNSDNTAFENARQQLEVLIRDIKLTEDRDLVWAEVQQSLGDYFWTRRYQQNWGEAWPHYRAALDWWAGAAEIELARAHYLRIVWSITERPAWRGGEDYYYWYYGGALPMEYLDNSLKISRTPNDEARAHYLIAMMLRNQGGEWEQRQRVPEEFEGAIKLGKSTDWYADALYQYGEWMENNGRIIAHKDGSWTQEPDYVKALELFRRFVKEFIKGETRHYDDAQQQIKNITDPMVSVSVASIFLPSSEIQYSLNWRNVKHLDLALYAVDLTRDVHLDGDGAEHNDWLQSINLADRKKIKSWSRDTKDAGDHKPGADTVHYDGKLPVGAYVLEARGEGASSRQLVLVTDASVVLKTSGKQALVYMCDALAGSPLIEARMHLWERYYQNEHWHWHDATKTADTNGIAVFDLLNRPENEEIFVGASANDRQAFGVGNVYSWGREEKNAWRIYAFTDRPAYRPKETAQWKFTARQRDDAGTYNTPANQVVEYEITDPRGTVAKKDKATLNAFGSAWASLELKENFPLGEYRVTFWNEGRARVIGQATLFRLEEYKLPEFKVSVETPEEDGRKKTFRLGEKVEVNVQADYYFGGAVANATVEVIVYQDAYYHYWHRPHDYNWFYEDMVPDFQQGRYRNNNNQIIKRETIKTDATGKASLTFDTPRNAGQDFEYRIEARVTDASRREIVGNGTVRVTGQRYYVNAEAAHNLYRPQDKVSVDFKALDANDQPVVTEGTVKVTRERWMEIWLDSKGREVKGDELRNLRNRSLLFPPSPASLDDHPWRLKFRGYEAEEILTRTLKTDTNGAAQLNFTPEREGYYRIAWVSPGNGKTNARPAPPIQTETTVWVVKDATTELGYRHGGVEIIADQDTFRAGQTTPVMLSVQQNDRYVLFTVEGADLYHYQLVHVTGTVKLVELPVEERYIPNMFLSATMVSDRQIFVDSKQVIVPPLKNFLNLEVKSDREQYQPRETGTFTITARDDHNEPVAAEIAFGLVDESVYYIQSDYAGDPRQFYFGQKRQQQIQTESTFNQKSYVELVLGENNQLMDKRDFEIFKKRRFRSELESGWNEDKSAGELEEIDREGLVADGIYDMPAANRARRGLDATFGGSLKSSLSGASGGGRGEHAGFAFAPAMADNATVARKKDFTTSPAAMPAPAAPVEAPGTAGEPAVQVRSDFRSTILWQPDIITGKDGKATVKVTYPDSLTGWKATARAITTGNQFGIASTNTHTKEPLIVRLEAPRFFVVGDEVTISAVVNNNTDGELTVRPVLELGGVLSNVRLEPAATLKVPANGESRADWVVKISTPGETTLKVTARGGKYADAMEKTFTVYEHGIEKFISKSGKVRGDEVTVKLVLPKERKTDSTTLTVQVTPSMAVTMLDALPYLIHYPYGCTEQTMSRFLPAAITAKTLKDLGLKPEDVMGHLFGGIETNSAAKTHPLGNNDFSKLDDITKQSLERLYDFQHSDGGWGWWKEGGSDHFMTAYVVWGLSLAHEAGISIKLDVLKSGVDYLDKRLVDEQLDYDAQAWMLHARSAYFHATDISTRQNKPGPFQTKAFDNLWKHRDELNAYTRSLLALCAHNYHFDDCAKTLIANLENGVKVDSAPDTSVLVKNNSSSAGNAIMSTAHWGEDGVYWRWSDGGVEATAFALRALLAIDPTNHLVEPVSNWLIKNRRGAQWSNTRDTAITVLAMNDYLRASGELTPSFEYELLVNDHAIATNKISGADVFKSPSQFAIDPKLILDGANEVRIVRRSGSGSIYFAANAAFFSLEEPVTPAGNEIFVKRQYYKLVGRPTLLKGIVYAREPLNDGGSVKSGDRVETVLTIEAKNNYEYLLFEDLKPAGFEAVEVRSGESLNAYELKSGTVIRKMGANTNNAASASSQTNVKSKRRVTGKTTSTRMTDEDHTGRSQWVYQELRDRKVALFIDKLPQGIWEIKYEMRAEAPGQFHALPVTGEAMYVPEIRCNGAEVRIKVEDK